MTIAMPTATKPAKSPKTTKTAPKAKTKKPAEPTTTEARPEPLRNPADVARFLEAAMREVYGLVAFSCVSRDGFDQVFIGAADGLVMVQCLSTKQALGLE